MDWQTGMNRAVDYIENNLAGEIDLTVAARYVGCSVWEFQRIFSFMAYVSVGDYIRRRRLALPPTISGTAKTRLSTLPCAMATIRRHLFRGLSVNCSA